MEANNGCGNTVLVAGLWWLLFFFAVFASSFSSSSSLHNFLEDAVVPNPNNTPDGVNVVGSDLC
jgi:hypothetical protein